MADREPKSGYITAVLVDDQEIWKAGVRSILENTEFKVVGEAASGKETLEVVRHTRPQLIILDPRVAGLRLVDATNALKQELPTVTVVILTGSGTATLKARALAVGAAACIPKTISCDGLVDALRRIVRGEVLTIGDLGRSLQTLDRQVFGFADLATPLTKRELEVLQLLATGLPNAEIAAVLFVATSTIKTHVENIIGKLRVSNRVEAVSWAVQQGLIKTSRRRRTVE